MNQTHLVREPEVVESSGGSDHLLDMGLFGLKEFPESEGLVGEQDLVVFRHQLNQRLGLFHKVGWYLAGQEGLASNSAPNRSRIGGLRPHTRLPSPTQRIGHIGFLADRRRARPNSCDHG